MSFFYYLSPTSISNHSDVRTTEELYEECAEANSANPKDLQMFRIKPIKRDSKNLHTGRVGILPEDEKECYRPLKEQNQHLNETLNRTVEALLTLQSQQDTYQSTRADLQTELNELNEQAKELEQELELHRKNAQQWKQTFESARHS
mmetsp:Transcript_8129/g.10074  ORF Transcript_8129/g.10074 Transcript_8129/m.10074 type:complete len:147 (-) Transcript_8129:39-479(-)